MQLVKECVDMSMCTCTCSACARACKAIECRSRAAYVRRTRCILGCGTAGEG